MDDMPKKIALVEDDTEDAKRISDELEALGYVVDVYNRVESAIQGVMEHETNPDRYALVITDTCLRPQHYGGFTVASTLRDKRVDLPIIVTTSIFDSRQIAEMTKAAITGIVDFYEKNNLTGDELEKAARNMISIHEAQLDTNSGPGKRIATEQGNVEISVGEIKWKGERVWLSLTQLRLVNLLLESRSETVSFNTLYSAVRAGYNPPNINAQFRSVITRFKDVDIDFDQIENVPFHGWTWR